jgi:predicted DsbA family dithiol-disulfide isomerase
MKIEIWSDVVCPWCYIGKRRFENALAAFEHRDKVEVTYRSFQLDPNAPKKFEGSIDEWLADSKGIRVEQSVALHARLAEMGKAEGLDYRFDKVKYGNTFDAHRLIHFAAHHGKQAEMKDRLQRAYFSEGALISDLDTLVGLAKEVGLDADEARSALVTDAHASEVRADIRRAHDIGVSGVPFFLIDEQYGVSGAQPTELFAQALRQIWDETHQAAGIIAASGDVDTL